MSDPGARSDLVGRILGYMDRPWKVAAIAVLGLMAGVGWLVWDQRERLLSSFFPVHHGVVLAGREELESAALRLVRYNRVAMAQVWAFDISGNAARFIAGINRDGTQWHPSDLDLPDRLPVMGEHTNERDLIQILRGDPVCAEIDKSPNLLFERLLKAGIKKVCVIPIPPESGKVLALFIIGWLEEPDSRVQSIAVDGASELAATLARR
jgi:hypothetical protein